MKNIIYALFAILITSTLVWAATTYTTNYSLSKPGVGDTGWGAAVNTNFDTIDGLLKTNADAIAATSGDISAVGDCTSGTCFTSGGTGTRLRSTNGVLTLGGVGGTNNEDIVFDFETVANKVAAYSSTGVTDLTWTGNLGLGTTAPSQKLDVVGSININSGEAYKYNAYPVITGQTALQNYYFGGAGNFTGTGIYNIAGGAYAFELNTTGFFNSVWGSFALGDNTTGDYNSAFGMYACDGNTEGDRNTCTGFMSLGENLVGDLNVASGYEAGRYIANGSTLLTDANQGMFLGANTKALADGSTNEIVIGYNAIGAGSNSVVLGNTSVAKTILRANVGIGDSTPASALTVGDTDLFQVNSSGDIIRIDNVTYNWPSSQGAASTVLTNDGTGVLSWSAAGSGTGDITDVGDVTSGAAFTGTQGNTLIFEGSTADTNEITVVGADPAADFTITIPAVTGALVTTGDTGSVTGTMILNDTVALTTDTSGNYVTSLVAGTAIDVGAAAEGGTPTVDWDSTEVEATTWGAGGNASNIWTFNLSGTDWTMTAGSALATFSQGVTVSGALIGSGLVTANANLDIGNGATTAGTIKLLEDTDNGSNYTTFTVGAQAGNIAYTWPTAQGSASTVLTNDGTGALSWAAAGGSSGFVWRFGPQEAKLPTSNPQQIDAGNSQWRGLYDATTDECARWQTTLKPYNGGALQIQITDSMVSATSGTAAHDVSIYCPTTSEDIDTDGFGTVDSVTATVAGTAGYRFLLTDSSLNGDSCSADGTIIVKICRDADGSDTATGDLELREVIIYE